MEKDELEKAPGRRGLAQKSKQATGTGGLWNLCSLCLRKLSKKTEWDYLLSTRSRGAALSIQ